MVILLASNLIFAGCLSSQNDIFEGQEIEPKKSFMPFTLIDSNNSTFNSTNLDDMVVVVNFFYTNCPDTCSIVTPDLKILYDDFSNEIGINLTFISITVDPWRDGPNDLSDYMTYFNTSWTYLTTEEFVDGNFSLIEQIWTDFGIGVVLTESENSTTISGRGHTIYYDVEHTEGIVIVGKDGYQKVRWDGDNWDLDGIRNDLDKILSM
tara:strand:- start:887 stop:1510 length:624 start_codon:yes stop_codon:yes gene_type:complete